MHCDTPQDVSEGRHAVSFWATHRNLTARHCEAWLTQRGGKIAAQTFAHELDTMRAVFAYAVERGWILRNPTQSIKRRRIESKKSSVPTREQLAAVVVAIRDEPRVRGGADLVELLAYSGMRLREATEIRWRDVDFAAGVFTITGGDTGTKNHQQRTMPITAEMRALLESLKQTCEAAPDALVIKVASAIKCLETSCRRLEFPKFHHHSLRHYFTTCAVESGVDIPTVARWLGHSDSGALLMKRYAHLQQAHSLEQIKRVSLKPKS
jgi:integrase